MTSGVFTIPLISTDGSSHPFVASPGHRLFIAGSENALLQILTSVVANSPLPFNPITLCGPTGVGKSHLLHGLVERHKTWTADARVTMITGADFSRGFASAIEVDSVAEWREKHWNVDLFVIDDLHELANKSAAQQELVHTIDALADQDRQIVFSSRQAAFDWNWMLPKLRSRLEGGLIIPVSSPSPPTQLRMAQQIIDQLGLSTDASSIDAGTGDPEFGDPEFGDPELGDPEFPNQEFHKPEFTDPEFTDPEFIVRTTRGQMTYPNIRRSVLRHHQQRIDSATDLGQHASIQHDQKQQPSKQQPSKRRDLEPGRSPPPGSLSKVAKLVAKHTQVKLADLLGPCRRHTVVRARGVAFYLARTLLDLSFADIGEFFGGRDHTTVMHSWRKTTERLESDARLKHEVNKLRTLLTDNFEIQRQQ